jgi:serine/threonine-protein kinase
MRPLHFAVLTSLALIVLPPASPAQPDAQLPGQALGILKANCARCHGPEGTNEGGINYILDVAQLLAKKKIVPGDPTKSKLFKKVASGEMPPEEEKPRPSPEDVAVLEKWIKAGAPLPAIAVPVGRAFRSTKDNYIAILQHLRKLPFQDRPFQRYFTLTHLHNNKAPSDADLRLVRAALSKFINHISWKNAIVVPEPIEPDGIVLAVDIRRLDWDRCHLWDQILRFYPYGLKHDQDPDEELQDISREIYKEVGCDVPAIRADWLVATASQPPLYNILLFETLLHLPHNFTAYDVEHKLGIDVQDNFFKDKLVRAGFTTSGVSAQNRIIERHESPYGAYWKSYDFKSNDGFENIFVNPLGPVFHDNPFNHCAFRQAGGEIVFNLPNGFQGYLLVNGKDQHIDKGPIEVVADSLRTTGTAEVVNGISCMSCHTTGMKKEFRDTVRAGSAKGGETRIKVRRLYVEPPAIDQLVHEDEERFLAAAERATAIFLAAGEDKGKKFPDFTNEPIGAVARAYLLKELSLPEAAYEVGLPEPGKLAAAVQLNGRLRAIGLGPLGANATIKREVWESLEGFISPFQEVALTLELGTPVRVK